MITCRQMTELVTDYLEGRLGWVDWLRFQYHLGLCVACRAYIGQMRSTVATVQQLEPEDIPEPIRLELLDRFKDWHAGGAAADTDPFQTP